MMAGNKGTVLQPWQAALILWFWAVSDSIMHHILAQTNKKIQLNQFFKSSVHRQRLVSQAPRQPQDGLALMLRCQRANSTSDPVKIQVLIGSATLYLHTRNRSVQFWEISAPIMFKLFNPHIQRQACLRPSLISEASKLCVVMMENINFPVSWIGE